MIAPRRMAIAIRLACALLVAIPLIGMASAAPATPAATTAHRAGIPPANQSLISPPSASAAPQPLAVAPPAAELPPPRAYIFRGALGPIFSTGMDRLAERIVSAGFSARVYEFTLCDFIKMEVLHEYQASPAPIVLIGHSMGGLCSVRIARKLQEDHIPVSLVVAIDPAHATEDVPSNVQRFFNIFLSDGVLGGGDVKALPGYHGHYASYDLKDHGESHINIDKMKDVHEQLVSMIKDISSLPATTNEPDPAPLRLLVPPQEPVELWDSGISMTARGGETLDQVAAYYRIPLWAMQQLNRGAGSAPFAPGQHIIVPRHLLPLAAAAQVSPSQPAPTQR
jgi:Alpha/beta hydrolase family